MRIERFEDLRSWQEARKLVQVICGLTRKPAFSQDRGVRWQIQEAAVSAMGNIAEAHGRYSFEDKRRFLDISLGSSREAQSHLYVALDQAYIDQNEFDEAYHQAEQVAQLVAGAIKNLDEQISKRSSAKPGSRRKERQP
jgi:four helix bundle protein